MSDLYRLIYASRNLLPSCEAKAAATIQQILRSAQRNNEQANVTGALMFNDRIFAQVLEGPRLGLEEIFGHVQNDHRHTDIAVLHYNTAKDRGFVDYPMMLVGQSAHGQAYFNNLVEKSGSDPAYLNTTAFLRCCMVLCWINNLDDEKMLNARRERVTSTSASTFVGRDVYGLKLPFHSGHDA